MVWVWELGGPGVGEILGGELLSFIWLLLSWGVWRCGKDDGSYWNFRLVELWCDFRVRRVLVSFCIDEFSLLITHSCFKHEVSVSLNSLDALDMQVSQLNTLVETAQVELRSSTISFSHKYADTACTAEFCCLVA